MFYRRKFYIIKNEFVEDFNILFNEINLPNQIKHGARLVGRWMKPIDEETTEVFAIWEYDSYDRYTEIEDNVRSDQDHLARIRAWFEKHGGRNYIQKEFILEMRNEPLYTTVKE